MVQPSYFIWGSKNRGPWTVVHSLMDPVHRPGPWMGYFQCSVSVNELKFMNKIY